MQSYSDLGYIQCSANEKKTINTVPYALSPMQIFQILAFNALRIFGKSASAHSTLEF
jgi:hypothetical protein